VRKCEKKETPNTLLEAVLLILGEILPRKTTTKEISVENACVRRKGTKLEKDIRWKKLPKENV
jgi:hypothetical protein